MKLRAFGTRDFPHVIDVATVEERGLPVLVPAEPDRLVAAMKLAAAQNELILHPDEGSAPMESAAAERPVERGPFARPQNAVDVAGDMTRRVGRELLQKGFKLLGREIVVHE